MNSITKSSSESSESSSASPSTVISASTTPGPNTATAPEATRLPKNYGSLTEKLHGVKSFIKKTINDEKADRLERKELDKVAIAKMRKGVDEYDEMLVSMQKETVSSKERSVSLGGEREVDEKVLSKELRITSLRRQLATMRKRS